MSDSNRKSAADPSTPALTPQTAEDRRFFLTLLIFLPLLLGALIRAAAVGYFSHVRYQYPDEDLYWELGARLLGGHGISLANDAFGGYVRANEPSAYFGGLMAPICAFLRVASRGHISIARLMLGEAAWFGTALPMAAYARLYLTRTRVSLLLFALALFPNLHFIGSFVMTENVLIPFVCLALYVGTKMMLPFGAPRGTPVDSAPVAAKPNTFVLVVWSILYGIIHLIKMNLLLFQPLQFLIDTRKMPWKEKVKPAAIALGVTLLVLLPWAWRNHTVMGTWALETKSGFNLWLMNNPARDKPMLHEDFVAPPSTLPSYEGRNEAQRDAASKGLFMNFLRSHPKKFLQLCVSRFLIAYRFTPSSMNLPRVVAILYGASNAIVYFFALVGLAQCLRKKWFFDAVGLVVYTVIITALTNAAFRHRSYADPAMLLLGVVGFCMLKDVFSPPKPAPQ